MCYSALVRQDLQWLVKRYGAEIAWEICFFEKVERHVYERRGLAAGERPSFFDLQFDPNSGEPMTIACVWAHWTGEGGPALDSFAAITDDPPPEVLATGHTRCVIPVKEENVTEWLSPGRVGERRLEEIL